MNKITEPYINTVSFDVFIEVAVNEECTKFIQSANNLFFFCNFMINL